MKQIINLKNLQIKIDKSFIFQAIFLIILQIFDGLLTYIGIFLYGNSVEGNKIIVYLIEKFGLIEGLVLAKFIGIICIYLLCVIKTQITSYILDGLILLYTTVVILWVCFFIF